MAPDHLGTRPELVRWRRAACALRAWIGIFALCIAPFMGGAANYTEITVELNSTWQSQSRTNQRRVTGTCLVGSNDWYIAGDFLQNAKVEYWLVGKNVVERKLITSSMYLEQAKQYASEKILRKGPPLMVAGHYRAGEVFTKIHPSPFGQPASHTVEGVIWLAFCSGDYLKRLGRQIPMPIGPSSQAFGYTDKTLLFDEPLGLPKSVQLFGTNGTLGCEYEVLATTNHLNRTFPVHFRVMQLGQPDNGNVRLSSRTDLEGRVTLIRSGKKRELPYEIRTKLEP
jgi:hypothetical protein